MVREDVSFGSTNTGDSSPILLWTLLLIAGVAGLTVLLIKKQRGR